MSKPFNDTASLRVFLALVETGSVLAASKALGIPRTSVRRKLADLESSVGRPLYHRLHGGTAPTVLGHRLAEKARVALRHVDSVLPSVTHGIAEVSGTIRMVLPVGSPISALTERLAGLREAHPNLQISIQIADDPRKWLPTDAEFALSFGTPVDKGPAIVSVGIRLRSWLLASEGYLQRFGVPSSIADLQGHDIAAWRAIDAPPPTLPIVGGDPMSFTPAFESNDIVFLRQLASDGRAIVLAPDGMLDEVDDGPLLPVLEDVVMGEVPLWLMVPEAMFQTPRVKAVLYEMRDFLSGSPLKA